MQSRRTSICASPRRTSTGSSNESSAEPMSDVSRLLRAPACSTPVHYRPGDRRLRRDVASDAPAHRIDAGIAMGLARNEVAENGRAPPFLAQYERDDTELHALNSAAIDLIYIGVKIVGRSSDRPDICRRK